MINKLGIFCGANAGNSDLYREGAEQLADVLSAAGITLVYGGSKLGLMGYIADRMLGNGGHVIGVIPQALVNVEIEHQGLTQLHVVNTMHERKALIADLSDGFIMLPGGAGSLDEFFDVITLSQLGFHAKPCGILNTSGYYDGLLQFLDHAVAQGFLKHPHRNMIMVDEKPHTLIESFRNYTAPADGKWIAQELAVVDA